jgi:hypothetical protein
VFALITDETNTRADQNAKFFVYGGLFFPVEALVHLDSGIARIREEAGYRPDDQLKFDTRSRPKQVTIEAATAAKKAVVELCIRLECRFIAYVVLHSIARNRTPQELVAWGANCVLASFNRFLGEANDFGFCLIDRLPDSSEYALLTQKFCFGLEFPDESTIMLDRVKLYGATCINASHACSAVDIVLGSFRYCINQPANLAAAKQMMADVTRLIWHKTVGDAIYALDRGLIFRPQNIKVESYQSEYTALLEHINLLVADAEGL